LARNVVARSVFLVLIALHLGACTSLSDVRESRGQGKSRTFDHSFDVVWDAIPIAMNEVDISVVGQSKTDGYYLGSREMTAFSWGERVAVFVDSVSAMRTTVEVVSKRRLQTNITAKNFEDSLIED